MIGSVRPDVRDHGWPTCAKCQGPVEKIQREYDPDAALTITVFCHGESETIRIPHSAFTSLRAFQSIRLDGVAFAERRLLP